MKSFWDPRSQDHVFCRYGLKKTMTFAVKKLDMKNSVNEYEIKNPPRLPTGKVFKLKKRNIL